MIIFDTDVCIELLHGNRNVPARREQTDEAVGISFMTVGELYYGAEKSDYPTRNHIAVEQFLLSVEVIQSDNQILKRFGRLKAELQNRGLPIADADALIAATTLEKSTRLITGNTKHFERISELRIENWR